MLIPQTVRLKHCSCSTCILGPEFSSSSSSVPETLRINNWGMNQRFKHLIHHGDHGYIITMYRSEVPEPNLLIRWASGLWHHYYYGWDYATDQEMLPVVRTWGIYCEIISHFLQGIFDHGFKEIVSLCSYVHTTVVPYHKSTDARGWYFFECTKNSNSCSMLFIINGILQPRTSTSRKTICTADMCCSLMHFPKFHVAGVDPGFDQGGAQIVTGLNC